MSFARALAAHSRNFTRTTFRASRPTRAISKFHTSNKVWAQGTVDSETISQITHKESQLTGSPEPVKGGPTAQAQKHANEPLTDKVVADINKGVERITQAAGGPASGSPAASAAGQATSASTQQGGGAQQQHSGILDSETISRITEAESKLTGQTEPVKGGPTAQAQRHAGEPIGSQNLHDITEGEKIVTGGERVKGGPTATAQSELSKSRS